MDKPVYIVSPPNEIPCGPYIKGPGEISGSSRLEIGDTEIQGLMSSSSKVDRVARASDSEMRGTPQREEPPARGPRVLRFEVQL